MKIFSPKNLATTLSTHLWATAQPRFTAVLPMLLVLLSAQAWSAEKATSKSQNVSYEKKTHLDFEEKSVDGEFLKPDGQAVRGDQNLDFDSLINPRVNFKKELRRSAGAIR